MNIIQRGHAAVRAEAFSKRQQQSAGTTSACGRVRSDFCAGGRIAAHAAYPVRFVLGEGSVEPFTRERGEPNDGCAGQVHWLTVGPIVGIAGLLQPLARALARRKAGREWDAECGANVEGRAGYVKDMVPLYAARMLDGFFKATVPLAEGFAILAGTLSLLFQGVLITLFGAGAVLAGGINAGAAACLRGCGARLYPFTP